MIRWGLFLLAGGALLTMLTVGLAALMMAGQCSREEERRELDGFAEFERDLADKP